MFDVSSNGGKVRRLLRASMPFSIPRLLPLAAALVALAVFFAPGAPPAAAQQQETILHLGATLNPKALPAGAFGCDNDRNRARKCNPEATLSDNDLSFDDEDYNFRSIMLESDGDLIVEFEEHLEPSFFALARERNLTLRVSQEKTVSGQRTVEVKSFTFSAATQGEGDKSIPIDTNVFVNNTILTWSTTGMTWKANADVYLVVQSSQDFEALTFGGATVADRTYTAGNEISLLDLSEDEREALKLPMAMGGSYTHTYTVTGLPAGLYLSGDRIIRGAPEAATETPATVNYTATDEDNNTVSLTFGVSVAPPVEFDADQLQAFKVAYFEYTIGQTGRISETLPLASGGHGGLTYHLTYLVKEERTVDGRTLIGGVQYSINDDAPGFSFDSTTRVLTSDTGTEAPSAAAFYSVDYWAEDENGAKAIASHSIAVVEAPSLPVIDDKTMTVGAAASITLPQMEGGAKAADGTQILYRLEPEVPGLSFNANVTRRTLSGTPTTTGYAEMTYSVTDLNGVSASQTFTINVVAAAGAPTAAPTVSTSNGEFESGKVVIFLDWADVSTASGYVIQIIGSDEEFPSWAVETVPALGSLTTFGSRTDIGGGRMEQGMIEGLTALSVYKVRVAAGNGNGAGPWSSEVEFTVPVGGM